MSAPFAEVLVVEDDDDIRDAIVTVLREEDRETLGFANGKLALNYLRNAAELPCLIILDLMMPIMDGTAFRAEQLKDEKLAGIPVAVVSAYRDLEQLTENLRAAAVLKKPPKLSELLALVDEHCPR